MAVKDIRDFVNLVPAARKAPGGSLWTSYDAASDTVYVNFRKPSQADDSEMADDYVTIRYQGDEAVGLTILRASQR